MHHNNLCHVVVLGDMLLQKTCGRFFRRRTLEFVRRLSYPSEPLTQPVPVPGLADLSVSSAGVTTGKDFLEDCQVTRLENGLRVASQEAFGQYSTVGGEGHALLAV